MSTRFASNAIFIGLLLVAGCAERSRNYEVLQGIGRLSLVASPGITLHTTSSVGTTRPGFASLDYLSEVIAENGAQLPPDLARSVTQTIRKYLQESGCNVTGGGGAPGFGYSEATGIKNAGLRCASISFEFNRSQGQVDVFVVERDYQFEKKHIVGQLIVLVRTS